jgi:hypothetical protein
MRSQAGAGYGFSEKIEGQEHPQSDLLQESLGALGRFEQIWQRRHMLAPFNLK